MPAAMRSARCLQIGAVSAAVAVLLGAFAAHGLKASLPPERLAVFETGVRYQMYHALALCLCGLLPAASPGRLRLAAHAFLWGTVLFSGSLYLLVLLDRGWLGAVTPFGGTLFVVGWIALALAARPQPPQAD